MGQNQPTRWGHREASGGGLRGATGSVRGQSNVIGYVLILGMVLTSATLIVMAGASVMDQYRELAGQESTTNAIEEIDTELSSVASVGGLTRTEFSIGDARPSQYWIDRSGRINVTANRNASCRATIPLSSLRYERDDGVTLGFEGGAVWRQENGVLAQTAMHTPPDFTYENGTISLTVIDLSGEIAGSENLVYENVSATLDANEGIESTLFTGECARPDNVTISVTSDFYRGWSRYVRTSVNGTSYHTNASNRTTLVYFDQDTLPPETDDSRNDVVDLTSEEFNDLEFTNTSIKVNKSANNTYTTIVTPLSSGSTQVGEIRTVETDQAYRPPLDVVFVFDESGSMDWEADGDSDDDWCHEPNPHCLSKRDVARDAAKSFVGELNGSYDRAAVVGFNETGNIKVSNNGYYMTNELGPDGVNGSLDDLTAEGSTDIGSGIHDGNVVFGLTSNGSREKVMILLGDGKNDDPSDCPKACLDQKAFDEALRADKDGVVIHAVGFGSPDNETMEDIAQSTGGTYRYVDDAGDLAAVFEELFSEISESRQVIRSPVSLQVSVGGTDYYPQIDGETSHLANGSDGDLNLNDPMAPSSFSFSIDVSDGDNVTMTARDYTCVDGAWERTGEVYENETTGQEYAEVRCTDIDESSIDEIPPSNTVIYLDGEDASPLLEQPSDWWNEDLKNETLAPYLSGPDNETFDLESNQAVIVFEYDDGDGGTDRLLALYRIGQSSQDAVPRHVFNIETRHLVIGQDA